MNPNRMSNLRILTLLDRTIPVGYGPSTILLVGGCSDKPRSLPCRLTITLSVRSAVAFHRWEIQIRITSESFRLSPVTSPAIEAIQLSETSSAADQTHARPGRVGQVWRAAP